MKRPTVDPIKQAFRKRLSWEDLRDMPDVDRTHVLPQAMPSKDPVAYHEPCYAVFNGIAWDLNEMTECNPDHIPEGWDGRKGDVVFRKSRDYPDDEVVMARIKR